MASTIRSYRHCGWSGLVADGWEDVFRDLDGWLLTHEGEVVIDKVTRKVSRVETERGVVYVKLVETLVDGRHALLDVWKRLKWRFGRSRFVRTMAVTRAMEQCGVGCPSPVLAAIRRGGGRSAEVLINLEVPHPPVGRLLKGIAEADRLPILERVAHELRQFHGQGFLHGDCIPNNLLWDGQHAFFIDNDRTVRVRVGSRSWRLGCERNLLQFCFHVSWELGDAAWGWRFLEAYAPLAGGCGLDWDGLRMKILARLRRKVRKCAERGHPVEPPAGLED